MIENIRIRSFGKLKKFDMDLMPGINVIYGRNEAGKSTLASFIRAMLYSMPNRKARKGADLSLREKYAPWDGSASGGSMTVTSAGEKYEIHRTFGRTASSDKLSVIDLARSCQTDAITNVPGEGLYGMGAETFLKTAFIEQMGQPTSGNQEMVSRLSNLLSSGSEEVSYEDALSRLAAARTHLKTGDDSRAKMLRKKKMALSQKLEEARERSRDIRELLVAKQACEKDIDDMTHGAVRLDARLKGLNAAKDRTDFQAVVALIAEADVLEETVRGKSEELRHVNEDLIAKLRSSADSLKKCENTISILKEQQEQIAPEQEENPAAGREFAAFYESDERELQNLLAAKSRSFSVPAIPFVLGLITGAVGILIRNGYVLIPAAALLIASAVMYLMRPSSKALYGKFGCRGRDEYAQKYSRYVALKESENARRTQAMKRMQEVTKEIESQQEIAKALKVQIGEIGVAAGEKIETPEEAYGFISRATQTLYWIEQSRQTIAGKRSSAELILSGRDLLDLEKSSQEAQEEPFDKKLYDELMQKRLALHNTLAECRARLAKAEGELKQLSQGTREAGAIQEEIFVTDEEIRKNDIKAQAVETAMTLIREAVKETSASFSPELNRLTGGYLRKISSGRYTRLIIDADYQMKIYDETDTVPHDLSHFSKGTIDQAYLALRMALIGYMEKPGSGCPLIFDDTFAHFDDERLENFLSLLQELSASRQIVILSCHGREGEILSRMGPVHRIVL